MSASLAAGAPTLVVGAYPCLPSWVRDREDLIRFCGQMTSWDTGAAVRVGGFEIPFVEGGVWVDDDLLAVHMPHGSSHVLTTIPTTITGLRTDPSFGLASTDESGRAAATARMLDAVRFAARVNERAGDQRVVAIEVHSAPRSNLSSVRAFERSLDELVTEASGSVELWVEHCDAARDGRPAEKGFLTLNEEIEAAGNVGVELALNWGRSVIEHRDVRGVFGDIEKTVGSGRLAAMVFSGVASSESAYGPPWADAHLPIRTTGDVALAHLTGESLLTVREVRASLDALTSGPVGTIGLKVGAPRTSSDQDREALLKSNIRVLAQLMEQAATAGAVEVPE